VRMAHLARLLPYRGPRGAKGRCDTGGLGAMMPEQKERLRILRELDVNAALKAVAAAGFIPDNREIALAGLHKARVVMVKHFTPEQIASSKAWLAGHGYLIPKAR